MFGDHDLKTAQRIAAEKTKELGRHCEVLPSKTPGKFTIGVEVVGTTASELLARIKAKLS